MKYDPANHEIPTLEVALSSCMNSDGLRSLAELTGEKLPTRKADLAAVIVRHLAGEGLRAVWQSLDELQRAAVAEVVHGNFARFDARRFRAKYGKDPDWGSADKYGDRRKSSPLCFFFYSNVIPLDLKARLKAFVPPPREASIAVMDTLPPAYDRPFSRWNEKRRTHEEGTEPVPLAVQETELAAQRELFSVLRLVDAGKVTVSDKTRRASASAVGAITAILDRGDFYANKPSKSRWYDENAGPIRAFAWPLLIQAGGLAQLSGTRLQLTRKGRAALSEPAAGTIRTLFEKWIGTTILDELARIECVKGQTGKGKRGLTAVSSRRDAIAFSLARCPAGQWIAADEFRRYMRATGNDFAVAHNAWNLYLCDPQYGSLGYDRGQPILYGRYLFAFLLEYVATLGVIDVALIPPAGARRDFREMWGTDDLAFFSRYDGLIYFRVTPLGAWCLGREADYKPAPVDAKPILRVLPNLEIASLGSDLEPGDRMALDTYADAVSEGVWRIEAGKLLAAMEEGKPLNELREFLTARSGAEIPAAVSRFLDDVAERSTKLHDCGLARLIECADPALAALIANDSRTRKHCLPAGDRHLVVPSAKEAAFRRALRDAGYILSSGSPLRPPSA